MKAIVIANHYPVCSGRYICNAIEQDGGEVRHYGVSKGRHVWGLDLPEHTVWKPQSIDPLFMPDVVIVADSDPAVLDNAEMWRHLAPVVVWGVDNHVRDYRREWVDHYFLAHHAVSQQPIDDHVTWLPCAYDAEIHKPASKPWRERQWDVAMLGVMYPRRWAIVQALREAGLKVIAGTGIVGTDYTEIYQDARVSLVESAVGDLPQRTFETAAQGCAVVHDKAPDLETMSFPGWGRWTYDRNAPVEQIVGLVMQANGMPAYGAACAQWGKNQTWKQRLQVVKQWVQGRQAHEAKAVS